MLTAIIRARMRFREMAQRVGVQTEHERTTEEIMLCVRGDKLQHMIRTAEVFRQEHWDQDADL